MGGLFQATTLQNGFEVLMDNITDTGLFTPDPSLANSCVQPTPCLSKFTGTHCLVTQAAAEETQQTSPTFCRPLEQHAVSIRNILMWHSQFSFRCTPGENLGDFTRNPPLNSSCRITRNSPLNSSCRISAQSLLNMTDNHPGQTSFSSEAKLLPKNASSTNTVNNLIASASNLKEDAVSLQVQPSPAQPSPAQPLCQQINTQQSATLKGHLNTALPAGFSWPPVADSHQTFHPASHVTAQVNNSMCLAAQQQQPATEAFLPRYTHTCTKDLDTRFLEHMLVI